MAESLNQQGSGFYREGKYAQALTSYLKSVAKVFEWLGCSIAVKAAQLDPKEPKYPSNASAVCYELGKYTLAITNVVAAWKRCTVKQADDPFAIKLVTRYCKAKLSGIADRTIDLHKPLSEIEIEIEKFATDADATQTAWEQLKAAGGYCAGHGAAECNVNLRAAAAEKRLRALPIYKSSPEPTLEYYTFSHDAAKSLLNGLNNDRNILDIRAAKKCSFLFGGSADGRHAFTTLQHLAAVKKKYKIGEQNIHVTLMDVHPAPLARTLVVFSLLQRITDAKKNEDTEEQILLHATLYYTYNWLMMPDYCRKIFFKTCRDLISNLTDEVPPLFYIDDHSLDVIVEILRYWSKPLNKPLPPMMRSVYKSPIFAQMDGQPPFPIPGMPPMPNKRRTRKANAYDDYEGEKDVFKHVPVLLPPKSLVSRHPALAELTQTYTSPSVGSAVDKAKQEVLKTWRLNPSIFDGDSTEHPSLSKNGYPMEIPIPYDNIEGYAQAVKQCQIVKPPKFCAGSSAFEINAQYFEILADAIEILRNELKIEMVVSDVMSGLPKLVEGELSSRPDGFPKKFLRIWLSNVPDYTHGFLSTAIYLLPYLEPGQLAMSNILLNSCNWKSMADVTFNYTLLYPKDYPRFLGCEVIYSEREAWDDMALKPLPLPRQPKDLASKKELHDWLARLLLCILRNGEYREAPMRVSMPANLGMFIHLLVHLHRVGFPSHWIGDFMQAIVTDTLVTDARPYVGQLPITQDYAKQRKPPIKVLLSPWKADLEVIIASTKPALPFAVMLPSGYPTLADICVYTAKFIALPGMPWLSPFNSTVGMIFYKPRMGVNGDLLARSIAQIIEGTANVSDADVQIKLSVEHVDVLKGDISWRMSSQWYEKMRAENWTMVLYRDDSHMPLTAPVTAAKWHKSASLD